MNRSHSIKRNLLTGFKKTLNSQSSVLELSIETKKGYASVLLSVVNYGYNIANRREFPSSDIKSLLDTETAISFSRSHLNWEENYLRNESEHPSRQIFFQVKSILEQILNKDENKEIFNFIEEQLQLDPTRSKDWEKIRSLGQWLTPEEGLEFIFSKLTTQQILLVCKKIVDITLEVEQSEEKDLLKTSKSREEPKLDIKTSEPTARSAKSNFRKMMQARMQLVTRLGQMLNQSVPDKSLLLCEAPATKYPCIIFDIRKIADICGTDQKKTLFPSDNYNALNKCVMSYFCGLINFYSLKKYGKNFIYTQPIVSFGSLRPTLSATGRSFRLSLGVVPEDFCEVVTQAYKHLLDILKEKESQLLLKQLFEFNSELKGKAFFHEKHSANETAQLIALGYIAEATDHKSAFMHYITEIRDHKLTSPEQIFEARKANFDKAISKIKLDETAPARTPEVLIGLQQRIMRIANLRLISLRTNSSLVEFNKIVHAELAESLEYVKTSDGNYSHIVSSIETLLRLLKLDYELEIIHESNWKNQENLSAPALFRTTSQEAYAARSGMDAATKFFKEFIDFYAESEAPECTFENLYFEYHPGLLKEIAALLPSKPTLLTFNNDLKPGSVHFIDIRAFPKQPIGQILPTDWSEIFGSKRPHFLLVDITSATLEDLEELHQKFYKDQKPPFLLVLFSSDNKFAQIGVDLVCMGEIRLYFKEIEEKPVDSLSSETEIKQPQEYSSSKQFYEKLKATLQKYPESTYAARAYRRLTADLGQRKGLTLTTGLGRDKILGISQLFEKELIPILDSLSKLTQVERSLEATSLEKLKKAMDFCNFIKPEFLPVVREFICEKFETLSKTRGWYFSNTLLAKIEAIFYQESPTFEASEAATNEEVGAQLIQTLGNDAFDISETQEKTTEIQEKKEVSGKLLRKYGFFAHPETLSKSKFELSYLQFLQNDDCFRTDLMKMGKDLTELESLFIQKSGAEWQEFKSYVKVYKKLVKDLEDRSASVCSTLTH